VPLVHGSKRSATALAACTASAVLLRATVPADEYWYINLRTIDFVRRGASHCVG
jgi:hypothetical protein